MTTNQLNSTWSADWRPTDFPFSDDRLRQLDLMECRLTRISTAIQSVDLSRVVGTVHPDYANYSWGRLMPSLAGDGALKRGQRGMRDLVNNPNYYLSPDHKQAWSFYQIGDDFYISEGNNRTVIARFFLYANKLPPIIHGVAVTQGCSR